MLIQRENSHKFLLNLLLASLPVSFIAGNLVLNLNIVIIIIYGLILFKLEIFKSKFTNTDFLITILFSYIALNGVLNNFLNFNFSNVSEENIVLIKSLSFFRFFFLYFVIKYLIINNYVNYKLLFLSLGGCSLLVSLDVIIQFIFGEDIFGYKPSGRRLSGPFGDELIAGSFIQRFFIFLPFYFILFYKIKKKIIFNFLFLITLILIFVGTILSGNRIPILMLMIMFALMFIYQKKLRMILSSIVILFFMAIIFLIFQPEFKPHYRTFILKSGQIVSYAKQKMFNGQVEVKNVYVKEIESGILTWEENKLFGGGVNSFRWNCNSIDRSKMLGFISPKGSVNCNNHPHNYYIEIAAELGAVGLILVLFVFINILYLAIRRLHFSKIENNNYEILKAFFIVFLVEIFPLKTTGSFFSTSNANFIFFILPFIVGLIEYKKITGYEPK